MNGELKSIFDICDSMIQHCDIDYTLLVETNIDETFFDDYNNTRVVNSFLFNFSKLQDKLGGKLFKKVLYELKEIDSFDISMIDVLNHLERIGVLISSRLWDELREIRNTLAHEYPLCESEKIDNIKLALAGYGTLKTIYLNLKSKYDEIKPV